MWNQHRQQQQQPEHGYNSFSSSVPFLLSSRFNRLFTNSPFSGRTKIFKTKSCKNVAANLPDLKKTRQSFAPPKKSPSRTARPQNLKKHLVKKEGRGVGDKNKKASLQQRLVTITGLQKPAQRASICPDRQTEKECSRALLPQTKKNQKKKKVEIAFLYYSTDDHHLEMSSAIAAINGSSSSDDDDEEALLARTIERPRALRSCGSMTSSV